MREVEVAIRLKQMCLFKCTVCVQEHNRVCLQWLLASFNCTQMGVYCKKGRVEKEEMDSMCGCT